MSVLDIILLVAFVVYVIFASMYLFLFIRLAIQTKTESERIKTRCKKLKKDLKK